MNQNHEMRLRLRREQQRRHQVNPEENPAPEPDENAEPSSEQLVGETAFDSDGGEKEDKKTAKPAPITKGDPKGIFDGHAERKKKSKEEKRIREAKEDK